MAKLEAEMKKLVPEKFHKWIKVFSKKANKRIPTRKIWDHVIELKKEFVPKKRKVYLLLRRERERRSERVYNRTDEKEVYQTIKVTTDYTSIFHREKE